MHFMLLNAAESRNVISSALCSAPAAVSNANLTIRESLSDMEMRKEGI